MLGGKFKELIILDTLYVSNLFSTWVCLKMVYHVYPQVPYSQFLWEKCQPWINKPQTAV